MIMLRALAILSLTACGVNHGPRENTSPTEELVQVVNKYQQLATYGWEPYSNICDGLLFASLSAVAINKEFNIEAARDPQTGQWFRKPLAEYQRQPCSSTISRDMFMGLFLYALHFKRLDILEDVSKYGVANGWVMGQESKIFETRVIFTPATRSLLAMLIEHLGGAQSDIADIVPIPTNTSSGFVSHLSMLQLIMLGKIQNGLTDMQLNSLRDILKHSGNNPLAQALYHKYTDGNQSVATDLLLSTWPRDRLPTSADWCEEWRLQRSDNDSGFLPCSDKQLTHSGADFLFAAGIVLGHI